MRLTLRLLAVAAIGGFWVTMWVWLIRSELRPEETALRAVPVEYALKQLFEHEQVSELTIRDNGNATGRLRLDPKARPKGYALGLTGNLQFAPAGYPPQRASWEGTLLLDREFRARQLEGSYRTQAPPDAGLALVRVQFLADFQTNRAWYRYLSGDEILADQQFTLDRAGFGDVLQTWRIDPAWTRQLGAVSSSTDAAVTARQTRFTLRDVKAEQVDATLVTVTMNGQTWFEIYESPTGQILQIKTLWGTMLDSF